MTKIKERPAHPERICWGCEKHCPANDLACGEDKMRAPHPSELFGEDWLEWMSVDEPADDDRRRRATHA